MSQQLNSVRGGLVSGVALILVGIVFLLDNLGILDVALIWPIIPIGVGLAMLIKHAIYPDKTSRSESVQNQTN